MPAPLPAMGASARLRKTIREEDVRLFAQLSLDTNPVHLDPEFAATTRFESRICHGLLYASLVSAVIGTQLPGPGSIYLDQSLRFHKPVFWNDEVEAIVTVTRVLPERRIVLLDTRCLNQHGVLVLSGEARILVPG